MKIYTKREPGSTTEQKPFSGEVNQRQIAVLSERVIIGLEERDQRTRHQPTMGDIRRLSPPGLKDEIDVADPDEQKNWKGIMIALLVISTICSFIMLSIVLLTPHMAERVSREQLKLEDFITDGYQWRHYNGTWISNTEIVYKEQNGSICIYDFETKHKHMLLEGTITRSYEAEQYTLSSDRRYILLVHHMKRTGHYSMVAKYTVFDKEEHTFTPLQVSESLSSSSSSSSSSFSSSITEGNDLFQYAAWVPNHSLIVAVYRNNIYVLTTMNTVLHHLTHNGREDLIINGVTDMTYGEHVWHSTQGFWLNSYLGGWAILYATIDSTEVDQIPYIVYSKSVNDSNSQMGPNSGANRDNQDIKRTNGGVNGQANYPKLYSYPYPKAGKAMPRITLSVTKLNDRNEIMYKSQEVKRPDMNGATDSVVSSEPVWLSPTEFIATWTRRTQDQIVVTRCREGTVQWMCSKIFEQKQSKPFSPLVLQTRPLVSRSGQRVFVQLPVSEAVAGTFSHIAMITNDGKPHYLTHGQFVVTDILAYREDLQKVYYAATSMEEPGLRHIYSLKHYNNSNERKLINCISCRVNESCLYNSAKFTPDGRHFVLECMGPDFPIHYLINTENETVIEVLDNSTALRNWASVRMMPKIRHYSILTPAGYYIRLQLIIPSGVNEMDDAKYPLVIETNRLPGQQSVNYLNKLDWSRYLTSRRVYVTAHIDTRGSAYQGDQHLYSIFKDVGRLELQDLKIALAYIKQLPYIDDSKIAVWGQEYGGFLAAALLSNENSIACAVSVSPITSWKNYLSFFTERFMGRPEENFLKYEQTELMNYSPHLKGRNLMIVHGTIDRRINIQHTMQLMKSLTSNAVQYRTQLYPDSGSLETWSLMVRYHFYRTMEEFFARCFQVEEESEEDEILPITKVIKGRQVKPTQQQQQQQQTNSN